MGRSRRGRVIALSCAMPIALGRVYAPAHQTRYKRPTGLWRLCLSRRLRPGSGAVSPGGFRTRADVGERWSHRSSHVHCCSPIVRHALACDDVRQATDVLRRHESPRHHRRPRMRLRGNRRPRTRRRSCSGDITHRSRPTRVSPDAQFARRQSRRIAPCRVDARPGRLSMGRPGRKSGRPAHFGRIF